MFSFWQKWWSTKPHTCLNIPVASITLSVLKNTCKLKSWVQKNETNEHPPQFIAVADPHCKGTDGTHAYAIRKWFTQHLNYQEGIRCSNKRENIVHLKTILCSRKLKQYFYKLSSSCYLLSLDGIIFPSSNNSMNIHEILPSLRFVPMESLQIVFLV